ncbi:hypothetical protein IV203_009027 [Nitzschia inconspicua]|uniref:Uncharacterized protein n=1 Tax=Nitzschia inconspicua TaxID=303405 RepID=A0A9K3PQ00_9STRA|nr:hypothetical protein IV203_009027 [Nitzschia inconspicua]
MSSAQLQSSSRSTTTASVVTVTTKTSSSNIINNGNIPSHRRDGCLEITVLHLVDLPYQDQVPLGVQFSIITTALGTNGKKTTSKVWSGPPTQRLRHRTSFRFAPGVLEVVEPLKSLYHAKLKVEVIYDDNKNNKNNRGSNIASNNNNNNNHSSQLQPISYLQGEFPLRQLCIGRPKDLTLKLRPTKAAISNSNSSTNIDSSTTTTEDNDENSNSTTTAIVSDMDMETAPTIRLSLNLLGPMRPTVQTALYYFQLYLTLVDQAQDQLFDPLYQQAIRPILPLLPVGLGLGALPVVTTTVVVSPLVIGLSLLFFPITLPLVVLFVLVVSGGLGIVSLLLLSTRQGRVMIDTNIVQHDFVQGHVVTSPVTQSIIYDTGDDDAIPNPVSVLRWYIIPEGVWYRLLFSLTIDLVGSMSYLLPVVGESFDGPWGPIQSMLIMALYNQTTPSLKYVSLAEEWLPFTDVLPSATIGWATENMPWLVEEWKEFFEKGGEGGAFNGLLRIGSGGDHNKNNNKSSRSESSSSGASTKDNKSQPTPEQKQAILRDMQSYSERLSVNS